MSLIFNPDGFPFPNQHLDLYSSDVKTIVITIRCRDGYELTSTTVADVAVAARETGGGAFTDIEAGPLDLTPYAGTDQDFDIRITAAATSAIRHRVFTLSVQPA